MKPENIKTEQKVKQKDAEKDIKIYRQILNYIKSYIKTNHSELIEYFEKYQNSTDENDLMTRLFNYKLQKYKKKDEEIKNYADSQFLSEFVENYFVGYLKTIKNTYKIDDLEISNGQIKIKYK